MPKSKPQRRWFGAAVICLVWCWGRLCSAISGCLLRRTLFCARKDIPFQNFHKGIQFFLGSFSGKGNPEGTVHYFRRKSHGCQRVASVSLGTGRACGNTNSGILQNVDGILSGNSGNRQRQNMGCLVRAVDDHTSHSF